MVKNEFFLNNSKNIDIWILRKEQNIIRSEFYMCVPSFVKIDWEIPVKNPRWPQRKFFLFVISTSDRGDFPRIIEIALFVICLIFFLSKATLVTKIYLAFCGMKKEESAWWTADLSQLEAKCLYWHLLRLAQQMCTGLQVNFLPSMFTGL